MPHEIHPPTRKPGGWTAVRKRLATWDPSALLALVKDLYDVGAANRDFIQARCQAEDPGGEVLEKYRLKVVEPFFPARGFGKLKLGEARKAIPEYRKATGNIPRNRGAPHDLRRERREVHPQVWGPGRALLQQH